MVIAVERRANDENFCSDDDDDHLLFEVRLPPYLSFHLRLAHPQEELITHATFIILASSQYALLTSGLMLLWSNPVQEIPEVVSVIVDRQQRILLKLEIPFECYERSSP